MKTNTSRSKKKNKKSRANLSWQRDTGGIKVERELGTTAQQELQSLQHSGEQDKKCNFQQPACEGSRPGAGNPQSQQHVAQSCAQPAPWRAANKVGGDQQGAWFFTIASDIFTKISHEKTPGLTRVWLSSCIGKNFKCRETRKQNLK